jgi:hypothetical protein
MGAQQVPEFSKDGEQDGGKYGQSAGYTLRNIDAPRHPVRKPIWVCGHEDVPQEGP